MKKIIVFFLSMSALNAITEKAQRPSLEGRFNAMNNRLNSVETKVDRIENSVEDIKDMLKKNNGNGKAAVESKPAIRVVQARPARTRTTQVIQSPRTGCPGGVCAASEFNPSGDSDAKMYCNRMYAGIDEQQRACYARNGSSNDPVNSGIIQY
jgi:hypothetical protein